LALVSWLGSRMLPVLAAALLLVQWGVHHADWSLPLILANVVVHSAHIGIAWWLYHHAGQGASTLDDPRSATVFLLVGPGIVAGGAAALWALAWCASEQKMHEFAPHAAQFF